MFLVELAPPPLDIFQRQGQTVCVLISIRRHARMKSYSVIRNRWSSSGQAKRVELGALSSVRSHRRREENVRWFGMGVLASNCRLAQRGSVVLSSCTIMSITVLHTWETAAYMDVDHPCNTNPLAGVQSACVHPLAGYCFGRLRCTRFIWPVGRILQAVF